MSQLKSHKEHNKAPLSSNLLAMGNPRGRTSMLETKTLTYLDTCTHIHAKINLPVCVCAGLSGYNQLLINPDIRYSLQR